MIVLGTLYHLIGPFSMIILLGLFVWSLVNVFVTVSEPAPSAVLEEQVWLLGTLRSLSFQLLISPVQWASEVAADIGDQVATQMECQAHHKDSWRPGASKLFSFSADHHGRQQPLSALCASPWDRGHH